MSGRSLVNRSLNLLRFQFNSKVSFKNRFSWIKNVVVTLIRRQKYETPPKTLTDVHGHQSLICLGLVIHGQTNGFSRVIVFLCFTNNQVEAVANFFEFANQQVW